MSGPRTPMGWLIAHAKPGTSVIVEGARDANLKGQAIRGGCIVTTERIVILSGSKDMPVAKAAIRATLVSREDRT